MVGVLRVKNTTNNSVTALKKLYKQQVRRFANAVTELLLHLFYFLHF